MLPRGAYADWNSPANGLVVLCACDLSRASRDFDGLPDDTTLDFDPLHQTAEKCQP